MVFMPGGVPFSAATEAVTMIEPLPRGIMQRLPTSRDRKNGALTFRSITLCQAASG